MYTSQLCVLKLGHSLLERQDVTRGKQEWYRAHRRDAEDSVIAEGRMASDQFVVLLLTYLIKKCYGRELEEALTKVYLQAAKWGRQKKGRFGARRAMYFEVVKHLLFN